MPVYSMVHSTNERSDLMHGIAKLQYGGIDGTVTCICGYRKYTVYPGRGWGRRSVGIHRPIGKTRKEYVKDKLVTFYIMHVVRETA